MTFTTVTIRKLDDPQVIIEGLNDKFFTFFAATSNTGKIFVGDKSVSYKKGLGFPITPLSDTIGLSNLRRFYVNSSNNWYMSGLANDIIYVLIEDDPTSARLDLIIELLTLIRSELAK